MLKKLKNVLAGVLLSAMLISLPTPTTSLAQEEVRFSGQNRYETFLKSAEIMPSKTVVFANGEQFSDALSAVNLCNKFNAKLVLVTRDEDMSAYIKKYDLTKAYIVGGESVISKYFESCISSSCDVKRLSGQNRYQTNEKTLEEIGAKDVALASGEVYADALSASRFLKEQNLGLLLASRATSKTIVEDKGQTLYQIKYIIGGQSQLPGNGIERISGQNRYDTSLKLAQLTKAEKITLVSGENFADALSSVNVMNAKEADIVLAPKEPNKTLTALTKESDPVYIVGGLSSVSKEMVELAIKGEIKDVPKEQPTISSNTFQEVKVKNVIDGDTIDVLIDGKATRVRFILVDTPETKHPVKGVEYYGKEAFEFTKTQLLGKTVYLEKDVSETDKYGRLLRYIWLARPLNNQPTQEEIQKYCFNSILLEKGYAKLYTYPPDVKYVDYFRTRENYARTNHLGLWGTSGETPVKPENNNPKQLAYLTANGRIIGNKKTMIYHKKGQIGYKKVLLENAVFFNTAEEAQKAGYRAAKR